MKKLVLLVAISSMMINCNKAQSKMGYSITSTKSDNKVAENQTVYTDDKHDIEIKQSGEFKMSDDEQSIISLSNGAYISYKKDGKRLKITKNEQGLIVYQINNGEKKAELSADEQKIVSVVLKDLIVHGFGVKDRAERVYSKGGLTAIWNEVDIAKDDYVKTKYFEVLFEKEKLSDPEIIQVFNQLSSKIRSDYEKASILKDFPKNKLMNVEISNAFYTSLKSINSDYEKADVIKSILKTSDATAQFFTAFQFIENIESDYEKSEIIKSVIKNKPITDDIFSSVLKASLLVDSDYEKSGIYKKVIKHLTMTDSQWMDSFTYIQKIESDYEKTEVLEDAYTKMPKSEKVKQAFSDCAKTISSNHEYGKLMKSIQ
jgi:ubiquinone biosynthesis protein Coq4